MNKNSAISPEVLNELEKKNPGLVAAYREKMSVADQSVQDAEKARDFAGYAGVAGKFLEDMANSRKQDTILYNRMGDLGKPPVVRQEERFKYDNSLVDSLAANKLKTAKDNRAQAEQDFFNEQKIKGLEEAETLKTTERDPTSKESRVLQAVAKRFSPDFATEGMSAAELKAAIPSLAKIYETDQTVKRDVARAARESGKAQKDDIKTNRDTTLKLSDKYNSDATTKSTAEVRAAALKAESLYKNPSPTNDMSLLYAFMKSNDPNSVVRESEFAAAARAGSFGDKVKGYANEIASGQLAPEKREYIMRSIREQAAAQEMAQQRVDEYYTDLATKYDADPEVIVGKKRSNQGGSSKPSWAK